MIIYYHCTRDSALLLSFLLTCHPYIPFHFMKINDFYTCIYSTSSVDSTCVYYIVHLRLRMSERSPCIHAALLWYAHVYIYAHSLGHDGSMSACAFLRTFTHGCVFFFELRAT